MFLAGFVLGALRLLLLAPRIGTAAAVALEIPPMLWLSWLICRRCTARHGVAATIAARLPMGATAFALLMALELGLALLLGRSPAEYVRGLLAPEQMPGLAAQLCFGVFPLLQARVGARG